MDKLAPYWKAVVGFVTPGVVALVVAVQDASPGGSAVTGPEWVGIGAACILTGGAVLGVKNTPKAEPVEGDGGPGMAAG
jgi:hypothetical protein